MCIIEIGKSMLLQKKKYDDEIAKALQDQAREQYLFYFSKL